ncbi:MAG: FliO/MopB family protein [Spirochaetes bacterium]|nr:FliO/MopB family protein [Spirochaetota bacterium]
MRHNIQHSTGPLLTAVPLRLAVIGSILCALLFLCGGEGFSQARRNTARSERKTEAKRRDTRAGRDQKKESQEQAAAGEVDAAGKESPSGGDDAAVKKGDEKAAAAGNEGLPMREYRDDDFRPQVEEESYVWLLFKTIFVLGSIVGVFYLFFKFVTKKTGMQILGQEVMRILSVMPLGQNKFIHVVDLAGRVLVLGVTDGAISVITEIREKDEIDRIRMLSTRGGEVKPGGFQEYLTAQISRVVEKVNELRRPKATAREVAAELPGEADLSYLREHRRRLRDLNGNGDEEE